EPRPVQRIAVGNRSHAALHTASHSHLSFSHLSFSLPARESSGKVRAGMAQKNKKSVAAADPLAKSALQPAWYNPFHVLEVGDDAPTACNAFIECPMRSKSKYELDKRNGILHISRILH